MKNKERVKGFLAGVAITLTTTTMITVFATPIEQAINVVYDNYRIIIDGADKSDVSEDSKPFIYNGSTYVPLRYISESMGKKVLWDGDTKSIYINDDNSAREDISFASQGYEQSDNGIYLDGNTNSISLSTDICSWSSLSDYTKNDKGYKKRAIVFNLNGLAKTASGIIDMSDTESDILEGKVIFYDQNDKVLYQSSTMRNSTNPISFDFSASGVLQLKVEFTVSSGSSHIDNCDIKLKDFRYSK